MTDARQTALRRIQKLQALAAKATGHEADSAARMAARLMVRYEIEARDVDAALHASTDPMTRHRMDLGRGLAWLRTLAHVVALANNCTTAYQTGTTRTTIYGRVSDCEISEYLTVHLTREVQREADAYIRARTADLGRVPRGARNGFCHSAVVSLAGRLRAMRREAVEEAAAEHGQEAASNALCRLDTRLAEAQAFAAQQGLGKARRSAYSANSAGARAGSRININQGLGGSSQTAKSLT